MLMKKIISLHPIYTMKNTVNGFVFATDTFPVEVKRLNTVTEIPNNTAMPGSVRRLCKICFCKFGELLSDTSQTVKDFPVRIIYRIILKK
jgi:hypothetical protein